MFLQQSKDMSLNPIRIAKRVARFVIGRPILGRSILAYHRIAPADFDPFNIAITPDEFERQLGSLRRKIVLPLREFVQLHIQNKLPRNAVAITFDDGYGCNALVAAPMLESFQYPATFFVISDNIARSEEFWWDELEFIVRAREFNYETALCLLANHVANLPARAVPRWHMPRGPYLALWRVLRDVHAEERRLYFHELRNRMQLNEGTRLSHRPMTIDELRKLAANPLFEIGGHTASHPSLPTLSPVQQKQEIISAVRSLETMIDKPIRSFSYPFGDRTEVTLNIVMAAGFDCAVTNEHRGLRPKDNPFELPRRSVVTRNARLPEKWEMSVLAG
jgi:peptidoglycan/xylan/chitin deacetylase (PgdA/CDA1 family)